MANQSDGSMMTNLPFMPDQVTLVESSNIHGFVNTDPDLEQETATLYVIFKSGAVYQYTDVESGDIEKFVGSESIGSAFHAVIRRQYEGIQIGNIFEEEDDGQD